MNFMSSLGESSLTAHESFGHGESTAPAHLKDHNGPMFHLVAEPGTFSFILLCFESNLWCIVIYVNLDKITQPICSQLSTVQ